MDLIAAAKNHFIELNELIELRDRAYENTRIYKERTKRWHDSRLRGDKNFKVGDKALLFNSRFKMHPGKLKSRWYGPNVVKTVYPYGTIKIIDRNGINFKVNRQRLKKYHNEHDAEDKEVVEFEQDTTLPVVWIDSVNYVKKYNKCLELEAELIKQHNMVEKDEYNKLSKSFSKLEQHCISLELAMQLNKGIFQKNNTSVNQTEPTFDQLFELNNLKAELQAKDTTIEKLKANIKCLNKTSTTNSVKKDIDEIETINIELEHRMAKLIAENEHLKQTYKQLYDSIKPSRVRAKEHVESLVNQLNLKSIEITDFKSSTLGKGFCHNNIKNDLRKLKGKDIVDNATQVSNATTIAPGMYKLDPVTLAPKDKNNRETHIYYLKHTMEQVAILREIVEQAKSLDPLDSASYSACKYIKLIQELLGYVRDTCPDIHKPSKKLVAVTPINKKKTVWFAEPIISSSTSKKQLGSSQTQEQTSNNSVLTFLQELDGLENLAGQVLQTITRMMDPADFKVVPEEDNSRRQL
ncbi:hypothetical protein Tco_0483858 [Tanacetum coccineum]